MATLNPYLTFGGNCREAMQFYRDCLGGELKIQTVGESPIAAQIPGDQHGLVMHAQLETPSLTLMASDMMDEEGIKPGNNCALMLYCDDEAEVRSLFSGLSAGARVHQAVVRQFWGAWYGDLTDKFGWRWMINSKS